jgi:hypothetical protein
MEGSRQSLASTHGGDDRADDVGRCRRAHNGNPAAAHRALLILVAPADASFR